jgi:ribonuclease BN (tRNA processing enzyme)
VPLAGVVTQRSLDTLAPRRRRPPLLVPAARGPAVLGALARALDDPGRFDRAFEVREYDERDRVVLGDLEVTFAPTVHPEPCFAARLCNGRATMVYGADGARSTELEVLAAGADLLLAEASGLDAGAELERHGHMTGEQAADVARRAGVKRLVLTHLSPWIDGQDAANLARAAARFPGPVELAAEGGRFAL